MLQLSKKINETQFSPIRKFNKYAIAAEKQGKKIYHLNIGQPDIETPECFMDAIRNYDKKVIAYAESGGITELHDAMIEYFSNYGVELTEDNIMITNGGSEALNMLFLALLNDGENAVVPDPFYTNYSTFMVACGGHLRPIVTSAEDGYYFCKREKIEAAIDDKTRAIICTTPNNPTGASLTLDEMRLICEIAKEHDLWVIADEVYREFVYDGGEITSFAMLPEYADRVIIVDSISKRFSACGGRIGAAITKNKELMEGLMKMAQGRLSVSTLDQIGAAALFRMETDYYKEVVEIYKRRCDVVYDELCKIPGIFCKKPRGSFYITVKLPVDDVEDFLMFMLTEFDDNGETAMFAPAEGFYLEPGCGKDEIRIAYVLKEEDLRRGVELIGMGLEKYRNR